MVIPTRQRAIAALAVVLWLAVTVTLLTAHWSLSCTVDGQDAGGIDCLGFDTMPQAATAPARWFGFGPLLVLWAAASAALVWSAILARRDR
jgi:hypothetical protein